MSYSKNTIRFPKKEEIVFDNYKKIKYTFSHFVYNKNEDLMKKIAFDFKNQMDATIGIVSCHFNLTKKGIEFIVGFYETVIKKETLTNEIEEDCMRLLNLKTAY